MPQTQWMTSLLLILSLTVHTVKSDSHVIVRPTDSDPSVCGDHAVCDTLSNLISSNAFILNNYTYSEYEFLPGTHRLKVSNRQSAVIQGERNVTWYGRRRAKDTVIVCEHPFAFVFLDIAKMELQYLHFSNCGQKLPSYVLTNISSLLNQMEVAASVSVVNAQTMLLRNVKISESIGYGLLVVNLQNRFTIISSTFLENNGQPNHVYSSKIGGNIMTIFSSLTQSIQNSVYMLINDSVIQGGRSLSSKRAKRCYRYSTNSLLLFQSNGLAVINLQHVSRLFVTVSHTRFVGNTGANTHPAVLVHDDSSFGNQYLFKDCSFETEGLFQINLEDSKYAPSINDSTQTDTHQVIVNSCSFIDGTVDGLVICVYPHYQIMHYVLVQNCIFSGYKNSSKGNSVSKIAFEEPSLSFCPRFRMEMKSSVFYNNQISPTTSFFNEMPYGINMETECLLLIIDNCTYANNSLQNTSTIFTVTKGELDFHRWAYPNGTNTKGIKLEQMKITNTKFSNNSSGAKAKHGGALIILRMFITIENCSFHNTTGTAVHVSRSVATLSGKNIIIDNTGKFGGGLMLYRSIIHFSQNSVTLIKHNYAYRGGGVFVMPSFANSGTWRSSKAKDVFNLCSFDFPNTSESNSNTSIVFLQNSATITGNSIYGLHLNCYRAENCKQINRKVSCDYQNLTFEKDLKPFFKIDWHIKSQISSAPNRLCLCRAGEPTNQCTKQLVSVFPGQTFHIPVAAVGKFNSTSKVVVKSTLCSSYNPGSRVKCEPDLLDDFDSGEAIQTLSPCQNLTFTVKSSKMKLVIRSVIDFHSNELEKHRRVKSIDIRVNLKPCPFGFTLVSDATKTSYCSCEGYILNYPNIECDERKGLIVVKGKEWIGFYKNRSDIITIHSSCPYDYCLQGVKRINLSEPDEQCSHNRSGVLCGACQTNLSMVLGTSNCKKCSNVYLLLIIPFALAGVALVVLLLKCNLTVSVGYINGIIFYANILQVKKALLFPNQSKASHIFSIFIAWLNLNLGIETCFFENMDSYAKVWLQFVFPVYVWMIIAMVVVLDHYSTKIGRLMGSNSVPVLATLFLLSYAKLLRTIILAVAFTFITFKDVVWFQYGNVRYFSPKHISWYFFFYLYSP